MGALVLKVSPPSEYHSDSGRIAGSYRVLIPQRTTRLYYCGYTDFAGKLYAVIEWKKGVRSKH